MDLADEADALGFHLSPGRDHVVDLETRDRRHHELMTVRDAFRPEHLEGVAILSFEGGEILFLVLEAQAQDVAREGHRFGVAVRRRPEPADASDLHDGCIRSTRSIERALPVTSSASLSTLPNPTFSFATPKRFRSPVRNRS